MTDEKQQDAQASELQRIVIPDEAKHLIRFLAAAWDGADTAFWENAQELSDDAVGNYPAVQGTANQMMLREIGSQPFDGEKVVLAVKAMLEV